MGVSGLEGVRSIRTRKMGQKSLVSVDVDVLSSKTVLETAQIAKRVRAA